MVSHLFFYQLMFLGLLWLCVMLHYAWPNDECTAGEQRPSKPLPPPRQRSSDPQPFPGLTRKPHCTACAQAAQEPAALPPPLPPPPITSRRGRPRQVDTSQHFCPDPDCAYGGWLGRGNISANGHPSGGPWRQLHCIACDGYFLETHGTPLHGKRVPPDLLVWAVGALAEGLGIRAVARVFEVDPNTVLAWLVEVAEHATAFSQYFLHDVRVTQVQLDELFALLSAVKAGEVSEAEAITRLSRSPHWVWAAIDPVTKLLLTVDVGDRTLAMAQRVVHQVVHVLAPGCVHSPPAVRPQGQLPSPVGGPCPASSMPRSSRPYGAGASSACATASCLAHWPPSSRCWPCTAGTSIRPSWSGSTSPSVSMSRRWDAE